jgi:hypothetical protein
MATNNDFTFIKSGRIVVTDPNAPVSSSSAEPESSSGESGEVVEASSGTTLFAQRMNWATEAKAGYYRIFDMQGRPLYSGDRMPSHMPAIRVIVVEYSQKGTVMRRYVQ